MALLNAVDVQAEIIEEFGYFGDWTERYEYLIDLGRKLPSFPEAWKTEAHRLDGCQSQVWIVPEGDAGLLALHAVSDSAIVSGLIALALRVYSDRPAAEILATEPGYVEAIGLKSHLSPTRSNGLAALLAEIRKIAERARTQARNSCALLPPPDLGSSRYPGEGQEELIGTRETRPCRDENDPRAPRCIPVQAPHC